MSIVLTLSLAFGPDSFGSVFNLYPVNPECVCVKTQRQTKTLASSESTNSENKVFQRFLSRTTGKELFHFYVGNVDTKWWNYGIALEADFNGDGVPDYSWYGGDDTSEAMYVALSSPAGYRILDVIETLRHDWTRRFSDAPPELDSIGAWEIRGVRLRRQGDNLWLTASINKALTLPESKRPIKFRVPEASFVWLKQ